MFLFIQGCEGGFKISLRNPRVERFSLNLCRAVKKCNKCILEAGCMGEGASLDCQCIEFVITDFFLFFSFFWGEGGVVEHPVFLNNISTYFPDASK